MLQILIFTTKFFIMKTILIFTVTMILSFNVHAQIYTEKYIKDAKVEAIKWLNNLNNKNFEVCWEMHSNEAKIANQSLENWQVYVNEMMDEFGEISSRKVSNAYFKSSIEGKENGFYVFIEYNCQYEHTDQHMEAVVLKQNDQFKWKIDSWEYQFISKKEEENSNELK